MTVKKTHTFWKWMKENVFKQVIGLIAIGILTGVWRIVMIVSELPTKIELNEKTDAEQDEAIKSLHRRITNLQTQMFYLKLGETPPPDSQN